MLAPPNAITMAVKAKEKVTRGRCDMIKQPLVISIKPYAIPCPRSCLPINGIAFSAFDNRLSTPYPLSISAIILNRAIMPPTMRTVITVS